MKKSFYWSLALIAGLVVVGVYSTNVFAEDVPLDEGVQTPVVEEASAPVDTDGDSIADEDDNCPADVNEDQADADEDGEGDVCDTSSDEGEVEGAAFSAFRRHDDDDDDEDKVNICHGTESESNPWNAIQVNASSVQTHLDHGDFLYGGPTKDGKPDNKDKKADKWCGNNVPEPETGSITIVKQVVGAGDQEVPTEWSFDFSGGLGVFSLTNVDNSETEDDLKPGEYTVTEGELGDNWTLTDVSCEGGEVSENGASVNINLGEDGNVTCTFTNTYRKPEVPPTTTTIHAQKIICDEESDLPNWGAGSSDITSTTASDWLAAHPESGCYLADWDFEWSYRNIAGDPDDNTPGFLGGNWYPFANGEAIVDVANDGQLGIREVFDEDYIPFSGQNTNEDVSAEMYCGDDVLHYDNWEWINATAGQPIYCVAWNVPLEKEEACRVQVVSQTGDEGVGNGNAVAAWIHIPGWTHALESVATWIWDTYQVVPGNMGSDESKTFTKDFYVDGPVNDATLKLAADNRYWVTINGDDVASSTGEFNYGAVTTIDVTPFVDSGSNTITIKIENISNGSTNPEENPAAGIYELVVNAEEELCEEPPVDTTSDVTICKYQNSVSEQNGLSDWMVWLDEKTIVNDDTIVADVLHDYSGETTENGCVTFKDVEFGDYTIGEDMPDGWQNVVDADGAVAAGSVVDVNDTTETFNLVNTLSCNPEVNLIQNSGFENPVVVANGGGWEQFVNGTPLLEWVADFVDTTTDAPLEIQSGYSGWVGHDGSEQYAELDSTAPTTVSQDVPTTPGNTYRLTYWRAARPGTEPTNNANRALVDGVEVDSNVFASVGGNPDWYPSPVIEFTATNAVTNIAFKDDGSSADSLGTFIDDVGLYCIPEVTSDDDGSITIIKQVEGYDGDISFDFTLSGDEDENTAFSLADGQDETISDLSEGSYTVTESTTTDDDWYVTDVTCDTDNYSHDAGEGDVEIVLGEDDHVTCTFTNTYRHGGDGDNDENIIVRKEVTEGSNTDTSFHFDANWTDGGFSLTGGDQNDSGDLSEETSYSVSEDIPEGWTLQGVVCTSSFDQQPEIMKDIPETIDPQNIVLSDGETVTCTFTNDQNDETPNGDNTPDDDNGPRPSSHRHSGSSSRGEVLGATTDTNFCPFLRDYQHINMQNDPSEVNKAKAFFNAYLGLALTLNGIFDQSMFNAVVQFQNMFKPDVLDTWTEEYPGVLNDNATGYLYQTTKWKINSIICPGYETFPDKLIIAPGTTVN